MLKRIARIVPALARDAAGLSGAALIAYGCWLIFPPAGLIVAGLQLVTAAWLLAKRSPA
jgi:glucose dehydrogenase